MFKNALFIKLVCGVTIYSFSLAMIPQNVKAWGLPPESFNKMYSLAQRGDVEALRASVYRGLNIDSVNRNGDTGLCIAAKRRDTYTYNAFRASGANPRHPCTQRIVGYDDFVQRSSAVPMAANSREAYSALGHEKYRIAPWVWWAGGGLLIGGVALALALGGGGGGGSSSEEVEPYNSLGASAGTKAIITRTVNTDTTNDKVISHTNTNTEAISSIDFNTNVLKNSEYLDVILKADKGASYINSTDGILNAGAGTVAMDAVAKSRVINNGYINVNANTASIGMVASESSTAVNNGNSLSSSNPTNGIEMRFSGTKASDTLIGMYADTNSGISNNGEIRGSAILGTGSTATAIAGSLIGMEGIIINAGKNLNQDTITLTNADQGKIELSAGDGSAGSETKVAIELIGMGSYLDYDFLNGSKSINRAEKVLIRNNGDIDLSYTGNYTSSSSTALRQGLGGVVGIRADANTTALNDGDIIIKLNDNGSGEAVNVAAGMQSVHGGKITNNKNISITSPSSNNRVNYGMLSVEGSGTVSALYTSLIPALINNTDAVITMEVSNSYGMASFNSGSLTNNGHIILGNANDTTTQYTNNIAMYANGVRIPYASLINNGYIDIYSYKSMAMQNDFGGATPIINNGTIHVYRDAVDAIIFGGAYSQAINQKAIIYEATPSGNFIKTTTSSDVANPFANYNPIIGLATMNTKPRTLGNELVSPSSTTEKILNDENASITIRDASFVSGMQVDTEQGIGINKGTITIENRNLPDIDSVTNNIGMYLAADTKDSAYITNSGSISTNTDFAAAMASDSTGNAAMLNEITGNITSTFKRSIGMYAAGRTIVRNAGNIDMKGNENTAIYANGNIDIRNQSTGVINVGAANTAEKDNSISTGYGIFSTTGSTSNIENEGQINVYTNTRGAGIYTLGSDTVKNKQNINVYTDDTNGIHIGGKADVTNSGTITVGTADKGVRNSHAIYVAETSKGSTVSNSGIIDFYNDESDAAPHGYAIYSEGDAEISNSGEINLHNANSSAIYANGGSVSNGATLNILGDNSWALETDEDADATNSADGIINVGTKNAPVDGSYGILSDENSTGNITNNGTINVYNKSDETYGIYAKGTTEVSNTKYITAFNDDGTAVYATGTNKITNSGEIKALGNNGYAVRSNPQKDAEETVEKTLTLTNMDGGKLILGQENLQANQQKTGGAAVKAKAIASIFNNGEILVYNNNAIGIDAESGTSITNANSINVFGSSGTGISGGSVDKVTNSGTITLSHETSTGNVGIQAISGTSIENTNTGIINIRGYEGKAINTTGTVGTVTNKGNINITTVNNGGYEGTTSGIGINVADTTTLNNTGNITIESQEGVAINSTSSAQKINITNNAKLTLNTSTNGVGIKVASGAGINNQENGIITITGAQGKGINVTNTIKTVTNDAPINISNTEGGSVGIDVSSGTTLTNSGAINIQGKQSTGISLSGNWSSISNSGKISLTNAEGGSVGISATSGTSLTNSNEILIEGSNAIGISGGYLNRIENKSNITLGASSTGIRSEGSATIINAGEINVGNGSDSSSGVKSYGIYAGKDAVSVENALGASIIVGNNGYGIYAEDPASIINNGNIRVGDNAYGIYAIVNSAETAVDIKNTGNITFGNNSYGIYVKKNYVLEPTEVEGQMVYTPDATTVSTNDEAPLALYIECAKGEPCVYTADLNSPASAGRTIWLNDEEEEKQASSLIMMSSGLGANVRLLNSGTITTANAIDFGTGTENGDAENVLAAGGQYVAESFTGQITADSSIVENGFENTYTQKDAFVGEDKGVEVVSNSYMFDASTQENDAGNTDVVMTKKSLKTIIDDADVANYLEANYTAQKGANTFKSLKLMSSRTSLNNAVNQTLGLGILPNIASQNMETEHLINRAVDDDVLTPSNEDVRARVNTMYLGGKADDKGQLSGYDEHTVSTYGFVDAKADMYARGGLGLYVARTHSKYNDGSSRYNNSMEMFVPLTYHRAGISAMFKPKGGFGHGHFRRQGLDKRFKGDTTEYYYGADTLARYIFDFGGVEIAPTAGLSLTGMHMEGYQESQGGLKVDGGSVFSTKSILGADVSKTFAIDEHQALKLTAGGRYYHEFGERYHTTANVEDMAGKYDITDERLQRNSGLLRLKTQYNYKQFTVGAEAAAPLKNNTDPYYYLNMGYWF